MCDDCYHEVGSSYDDEYDDEEEGLDQIQFFREVGLPLPFAMGCAAIERIRDERNL